MKPAARCVAEPSGAGRQPFKAGLVATLLLAMGTLTGCASSVERQIPLLYAPGLDRVSPASVIPDARKTAQAENFDGWSAARQQRVVAHKA